MSANMSRSLDNTVAETICYPAISTPFNSEDYDAIEKVASSGIYRVFRNASTAKQNPNPLPLIPEPIPLPDSEEMEG